MVEDRIEDDEILYRRIIPTYFSDPTQPPSYLGFRPMERDTDGLSLARAKYRSAREVAAPPKSGPLHPLAELRAGDLKTLGMMLRIDPGDHSHVLIENLNARNKRDPLQEGWQLEMANRLCRMLDANPAEPVQLWPPTKS